MVSLPSTANNEAKNMIKFPTISSRTASHLWTHKYKLKVIFCVTSRTNILYPLVYSITTTWNNHRDTGQRSHFWSQYTTVTVVYPFKNSSTLNNLLQPHCKANPASWTWNHRMVKSWSNVPSLPNKAQYHPSYFPVIPRSVNIHQVGNTCTHTCIY